MKWIGQHIVEYIARFKDDVFLENIDEVVTTEHIVAITDDGGLKRIGMPPNGDITGVAAGTGLSGGGTEGDVELTVDASLTHVTGVGNITTGGWRGTAIDSAYLDADTAHLTTTQTFTGAKTFTDTVALTGTGRITGIDTVSAATDATNKSYVDGKFTYVYMQIYGRSSTNSTKWMFPDASGDGNFNWEEESAYDAWDGGSSGIDNDGTNTTKSTSTVDITRDVGVMGFVIPYECTLVGFKCIGKDLSGNDAFKAGLWSSAAYSAYGGSTGTTEFTLRAVATATYAGGGGSNFNGICKLDDLDANYVLSAGEILLPSMSETHTSRHYISMTIVLKVPITII